MFFFKKIDLLIDYARKFPFLNKIPVNFYRFVVVGLCNFVVDFIVLSVLFHIFGMQGQFKLLDITENVSVSFFYANIFAVIASTTMGYILNKTWSFEDTADNVASQFSKYALVAVINLILNNIMFGILMNEIFADVDKIFIITSGSKIVATSFQVVTSYVLYKFIVFRQDTEVISETIAA